MGLVLMLSQLAFPIALVVMLGKSIRNAGQKARKKARARTNNAGQTNTTYNKRDVIEVDYYVHPIEDEDR